MRKMNEINFSALDIKTESEFTYRDDRLVNSIPEHAKKVYLEFVGNLDNFEKECEPLIKYPQFSAYMEFTIENGRHYVAFFTNSEDSAMLLFRKGHEQAHILHAMGKIVLLQDKLGEMGVKADLSSYNRRNTSYFEREVVANIGGLFALHKFLKENDEKNLSLFYNFNPRPIFDHYLLAVKIYKQGMIDAQYEQAKKQRLEDLSKEK